MQDRIGTVPRDRPLTHAAPRSKFSAPRNRATFSFQNFISTALPTALATADSGMQSNEQKAFHFGYMKIHHVGRMSACSLTLQAHFFLCLPVR